MVVETAGDVGGEVGDVVRNEPNAVSDNGMVGECGADDECGVVDGAWDGSEVSLEVLDQIFAS